MIVSSTDAILPPARLLYFLPRMSRQNYLVTPVSDFRLFGRLKDSLREFHYANDEALQNAVIQWLQKDSNLYPGEIQVLV